MGTRLQTPGICRFCFPNGYFSPLYSNGACRTIERLLEVGLSRDGTERRCKSGMDGGLRRLLVSPLRPSKNGRFLSTDGVHLRKTTFSADIACLRS